MSDPTFDPPDDDDAAVPIPRRDLRNLREKARRADSAERELAFAKAGIDLADKRSSYFVKGYDGDLEPTAIKGAWDDAFGTREPPPPPAPTASPGEIAAHQEMAAAMTGVLPPNSSLTLDDMANASSPEEVMRMATELGLTRPIL